MDRRCLAIAFLLLLPGCLGPSGEAPVPGSTAPVAPAPLEIFGSSTFSAAACVPPVGALFPCLLPSCEGCDFVLPERLAEGYVDVSWKPAGPLMDTLRIRVSGRDGPVAVGEGSSPLRIPLEDLAARQYDVRFSPVAGGAAIEQTVEWVVRAEPA